MGAPLAAISRRLPGAAPCRFAWVSLPSRGCGWSPPGKRAAHPAPHALLAGAGAAASPGTLGPPGARGGREAAEGPGAEGGRPGRAGPGRVSTCGWTWPLGDAPRAGRDRAGLRRSWGGPAGVPGWGWGWGRGLRGPPPPTSRPARTPGSGGGRLRWYLPLRFCRQGNHTRVF